MYFMFTDASWTERIALEDGNQIVRVLRWGHISAAWVLEFTGMSCEVEGDHSGQQEAS